MNIYLRNTLMFVRVMYSRMRKGAFVTYVCQLSLMKNDVYVRTYIEIYTYKYIFSESQYFCRPIYTMEVKRAAARHALILHTLMLLICKIID